MFPLDVMLLLSAHLIVPVADDVPNIDVSKMCRAMVQTATDSEQQTRTCTIQQQAARDELVKDWKQFAAADKAGCVSMTTARYLPSYVELLTCLETARDAKRVSGENMPPLGQPSSR